MFIKIDDLTNDKVINLIEEHLHGMAQVSQPENIHALAVDALRRPEITFWTAWEEDELLGCGALKELDSRHGEVKSMRTASAHLRKGVARTILHKITEEARQRGYYRLSLETGSGAAFAPARKLYKDFEFHECHPFADYTDAPNSTYLTKEL